MDAEARPLELTAGSPSTARVPRLISADDHLGSLSCDQTGQDSLEYVLSPEAPQPSRLADGALGSVTELAAAPDGSAVAAAASGADHVRAGRVRPAPGLR